MISKIASLALVAAPAMAHLTMWHPSMYGFNDYRSAYPKGYPNYTPKSQWWFGGTLDKPPAAGQVLEVPAGGTLKAEVACSKDYTSFGGASGTPQNACPNDFNSLHAVDQSDVKGCALAIAYNTDPNSIQPEDLVVISVNHQCPWSRDVDFEIPADLPSGDATIAWGWIHGERAGGDEMYMTGFRARVTGGGNGKLAKAKAPVFCSGDKSNCSGAKQMLFFSNVEGANVQRGPRGPPSYNDDYGWANGAQNDIFESGAGSGSGNSGNSDSQTSTSTSTSARTRPTSGNNNNSGEDNSSSDSPASTDSEWTAPTSTRSSWNSQPTHGSDNDNGHDNDDDNNNHDDDDDDDDSSSGSWWNNWRGHRGKHGGSSYRQDRYNSNGWKRFVLKREQH